MNNNLPQIAPTKEEAGAALFRLATGTSSPDLDVHRVLRYFDLAQPGQEVPRHFKRAIQSVLDGLRVLMIYSAANDKE